MAAAPHVELPPHIDIPLKLVYLDWISPTIGLIQCFWNGFGYVFKIPIGYRTGHEIVSFLHRHRICTWAHGIDPSDKTICFIVAKEDAQKAKRLLVTTL